MLSYIFTRLRGLVFVVIFVTFVSFLLMKLAPGDPALILLQKRDGSFDQLAYQAARQELGLDHAFLRQYFDWLVRTLQGDLGTSYYRNVSVSEEIARSFPVTMQLAASALSLAFLIALTLGIMAARKEGGAADVLTRGLAVAGTCVPAFWLGLVLIFLFAVRMQLLPAVGREGFSSFILPTLTLAFGPAFFHARLLDAALKETKEEDYVLFARAKGLSEWHILLYHRLKPALIPVIASFGVSVGAMLGGTVIVESIFAWPGMGTLVVEAIFNRDYPIIQGYVLVMAAVYTVVNLGADLLCAILDPRITVGAAP